MKVSLISIVITAVSLHASADSCRPVRLDQEGGSLEHVPVQSQKALGTCYGYAAAQMYDAFRFTHYDNRFDKHSSSIFAVIDTADEIKKNSIEGGNGSTVLKYLNLNGSCSESYVQKKFGARAPEDVVEELMRIEEVYADQRESQVASYNRMNKVFYKQEMKKRETYLKSYEYHGLDRMQGVAAQNATRFSYDAAVAAANQKSLLMTKSSAAEAGAYCLKPGLFAKSEGLLDYTQANAVAQMESILMKADSSTDFLKNALALDCPESEKIETSSKFIVDGTNRQHEDTTGLVSYVNDYLKTPSSQPISVGFCEKVFRNGPGFSGLSDCGKNFHEALIIGRRVNPAKPESCQFLVRNAWGKDCGSIHPEWTCDKAAGGVWIDAAALMNNAFELKRLRAVNER